MSRTRGPTQSIVAEQAVIGAVLRSADSYWKIHDRVRHDHFEVPIHREIYRAVSDICLAGNTLSMRAVEARLPEAVEGINREPVMVQSYIANRFKEHEEIGNTWQDLAEQVVEAAERKRLQAVSQMIDKALKKGEMVSTDIAAEAEAMVLDIMRVSAPRRPRRMSEIAVEVLRGVKNVKAIALPKCLTGLNPIDEILGVMLGGDSGYLLASQGDGKTALAAQICAHISLSRPVLMIQMEMGAEQVAARELAAASNIPVTVIHERSHNSMEEEYLIAAEQKVAEGDFYLLDEKKMTIRQIRAHAIAMKRSIGLGFLCIDQFNKIKAEGRTRDKFEKMEEIATDIKDLAKELNIPILTLGQRTRGAQRRDDPTPHIMDAESPAIEHNADWILGLWRKINWLMQNRPKKAGTISAAMEAWDLECARCRESAEVITLKTRRGQAYQQRELKWHGQTTRFSEIV